MFISTCIAYNDVEMELGRLEEVYVLTIRDTEDNAVSVTLNYTQAKLLAEGVSQFLSQTPIHLLLNAQNGALLGGAIFQSNMPETSYIEQEGEENSCQQLSLSAQMADAS
ncbi:hypothetical protein SOV_52430 [Sporomusa ovata DSM 2662]|uniref:Uncharacterized protein n=1 Tax=Sporomusa ovata TaxID=2378 RepID=A0A0U1KRB4_9FIRM|nr:hypothetical protein [Sporomusa ovata]EQB27615.1 hypothetical protein SOV_2c05120 [Sporomusa ovata DSM 2662]CQR69967.1 hypothetical protein SpAn4DRAFT_4832 [Sporomusa ovata]